MEFQYDYIICGAGCAGLSLAYRLTDPAFSNKRILLVEKGEKNKNDRTWCFWEKGEGMFDPIVYNRWSYLNIYAGGYHKRLNIHPYKYKMIRGIDFYEFCKEKIRKAPQIEWINGIVQNIKSYDQGVSVITDHGIYTGKYAFSSILNNRDDWTKTPYTLQHFRGWFIHSEKAIFDSHAANFMDFRIDQENETRFFYVLPKNKHEALVELAVFSQKPWESQYYDVKIAQYLKKYFNMDEYKILETENGVIPMTSYAFEKNNTEHCIHIGTAGGRVKASTGFAFDRIQKQSDYIIEQLVKVSNPNLPAHHYQNKYRWYDKVLLKVLTKGYAPADTVFGSLFQRNKIVDVLDFLNEESSWLQELKILSAPPKWPFIRAALNL